MRERNLKKKLTGEVITFAMMFVSPYCVTGTMTGQERYRQKDRLIHDLVTQSQVYNAYKEASLYIIDMIKMLWLSQMMPLLRQHCVALLWLFSL